VGIQLRSFRTVRVRTVTVTAALLAVVAAITPVAGASPNGTTGVIKETGRAKVASALFTNEPSGGGVPGVVYTDVSVSGGVLSATGSAKATTFASLVVVKFRYNEFGEAEFVSQELGDATGAAVSFSLAPRLARASLVATMRLTRCVVDETIDCTTAPSASTIRASWTAIAPALYLDYRLSARTRGLRIAETFRGTRRNATVTGTLNGRGLGTVFSASIDDQRGKTMLIDHIGAFTTGG
jgi:hypothetical protein